MFCIVRRISIRLWSSFAGEASADGLIEPPARSVSYKAQTLLQKNAHGMTDGVYMKMTFMILIVAVVFIRAGFIQVGQQ
jgi:hypothetical protein